MVGRSEACYYSPIKRLQGDEAEVAGHTIVSFPDPLPVRLARLVLVWPATTVFLSKHLLFLAQGAWWDGRSRQTRLVSAMPDYL